MTFLDKLEKRFGKWAISNVILGLIIAQICVYALMLSGYASIESLILNPMMVIEAHQYWRLVTFVICPPFLATGAFDALFLGLFWYIFWMMSQNLESVWGAFRFNVYLYSGILFTLLGTFTGYFISPETHIFVSPRFLYTSVFFAFAVFFPHVQFYLFFVIPVKVKWLAYIIGAFTLLGIIFAPTWGYKLAALGPFVNFLLFFRKAFTQSVEASRRRKQFAAEKRARDAEAFHVCTMCGATDKTHPDRSFRYKEIDSEPAGICNVCRDEGLEPEPKS